MSPLLYRMKDLPAVVGISRSEIYRQMGVGQFPLPVRIGVRARAWRAQDIQAWQQALVQNQSSADASASFASR